MTIIQERLFTVDDVWELSHRPENDNKRFHLIDGELYWDMPPGEEHGHLAFEIAYQLRRYLETRNIGRGTVETGYHPPDDRFTLLAPDLAFTSKARAPRRPSKKFVPVMPDLAVEILSPSNTLNEVRRKAAVYIAHCTTLVWIILPDEEGAEVCRAGDAGEMTIEFVGRGGTLSGEAILPGFTLELEKLFESV